MLSGPEFELLNSVRISLEDAPRGRRKQLVQQACGLLNCSPNTLYRKLGQAGFDSGRKRRSDAGNSVLNMAHLRAVAGVLMASYNGKDQRMTIGTALDIVQASARANGEAWPDVSESTVSRQLYANHLHPEQLSMPTESVQLTSKHPNHVWQVDSTTGAYYYLPGGRLRWMDEAEYNKNKVANLVKASSDLLTRYSAADHTSHAFKVRYYLGGESARNLLDFLVWAIWKQDSGPMCGVPLILMTDRGPANKSRLMALFCGRLGIEHIMHKAGNARATGSVEKSHDLARMHLETRYHFTDPAEVTLEKLNLDGEAWAAAFCSVRIHTRHGRARFGAWMEINKYPGALRMPKSLEVLKEAATSEPETPRVNNDRRIRYRGRQYRLHMLPGAAAGLRVTVQMNVYRDPAIDVKCIDPDTGEETWHVVEPEKLDDWGFDGERVIGEGYKAPAGSVLDRNRAILKKDAYRVGDNLPTLEQADAARKVHAAAYKGQIDPMADVKATQVPTYLPRHITPLELPTREVAARLLNIVEACKRIKDEMGAAYQPQIFGHLSEKYADRGIPETDLPAVIAVFTTARPASNVVGLRAAGGGDA